MAAALRKRFGAPQDHSVTPAVASPVSSDAREFVLKLGRGLHAYGYPAHRLEDALTSVAQRLGIQGHFFSNRKA